jgi:CDGSH-type Zn-finger protein/uncharacterized Fe-S cluster protein YjdI
MVIMTNLLENGRLAIAERFGRLPRATVCATGDDARMRPPARETLIHALYEAAELEHNLMCTYLYAAFSLKSGEAEGLSATEADAVARWRRAILKVSIEEMGHLVAVWNLTSALGASPQFGRANFPLPPGMLPASVVVKLVPFGDAAIQHFAHLERPADSDEPEGEGFLPEARFSRAVKRSLLTPTGMDYETIGVFYAELAARLRAFVEHHGEAGAFYGDPALQLSAAESELVGIKPVICIKTALAALGAIVEQGEGAPGHSDGSHYRRFVEIREELARLRAANPAFEPALPVASNPVLRPPPRPEGRVWIEDDESAATVDLANATYALMLRLLAYSYSVPRPSPAKRLCIDLAVALMRAVTLLAEHAARLPAGPSNPRVNAGVSFTALRDAAPFPAGTQTGRFFVERLDDFLDHAAKLGDRDPRVGAAARILRDVRARAERGFRDAPAPAPAPAPPPVAAAPAAPGAIPAPTTRDGVDTIEGRELRLVFQAGRCIHSRFCVTGAPEVFLANVRGPWIRPDAVPVEKLVEIAHACPSGAIRYERKDGHANEAPPPVNLIAIRENGPYAVRADLRLDGAPGFRATLCRCGASKHKPFCDSSHHAVDFAATGEPLTESADMLPVRDGPLEIDPLVDGPLHVRGNLEITSGTGRVVARLTQAKLCRCGGSANKPFCDGTHARNGFRS